MHLTWKRFFFLLGKSCIGLNLNLQKYRCMVFFFTPTDKVLQLEEEAIKHKWVSDASVFSFFFFLSPHLHF